MNILSQYISYSIFIGVGATIFMDLYALFIKTAFKIPSLDYALVGRWIGHFKQGVFAHKNILHAGKITGERALGWMAHYLIGISFALFTFIDLRSGLVVSTYIFSLYNCRSCDYCSSLVYDAACVWFWHRRI